MEYERNRPGLLAGFALSSGSSFSRDSLRDDVIPEREEDSEVRPISGSDEASDASSRESRGGFWISEKPRGDILVELFREPRVDITISSCSRLTRVQHLIVRRSKPAFQTRVLRRISRPVSRCFELEIRSDLQPA